MSRRLSHILPVLLLALALCAAAGALLLRARSGGTAAGGESGGTLTVTELMTGNTVGVTDASGAYCQWVELQNTSAAAVELGGYELVCGSDSARLPEKTLRPGEYYLSRQDEWGFALPESGTLVLRRGARSVCSVKYAGIPENYSLLVSTGEKTGQPTPGYETPRAADALVISEVMSHNDVCPVNGALCDWVELYNAGTESLELSDYFLSKKESDPYACRLPERTLPAGGYAVLVCGSDLSFRVSKDGASLYLTRSDGVGIYALAVPALDGDQTFTYDRGVVDYPTPGSANAEENAAGAPQSGLVINEVMSSNASYWPVDGEHFDLVELYNAGSEPVDLSGAYLSKHKSDLLAWQLPAVTLGGGEYYVAVCSGRGGDEAPFRLSASGEKLYLTAADGTLLDALAVPAIPTDRSWGRSADGLVYFAVPTPGEPNGTGYAELAAAPAASVPSGMYDAPFAVTLSGGGEIRYTIDGTEPDESSPLYQGEAIPVDSTMAVRAICYDGDRIPSGVYTYNYFIGIPDYELDVLKLTLSPVTFASDLSYETNTGKFHANLALYSGGAEQFNIDCAVSLFGSGSRAFEKKSYQINFQAPYGPAKLHYRLFDDLALDEFDSIVLRSGAQDQFYATLRDEFFTSLLGDACGDLLVQDYRPVNLYVNGAYRGIYYIRERVTDDMVAAHCGVSAGSVTIVKNMASVYTGPDGAAWTELLSFIRSSDLSADENYQYVAERLDIGSTIDYFLSQMWSTNYDIGNVKVFRSSENDGKWRFVLYDLDVAFLKDYSGSVERMVNAYDGFLRSLLANAAFREQFTARMAELLAGPLREDTVLGKLDAFVSTLDGDMQYNCQRWSYNKTYEGWLAELNTLRQGENIGIAGWNDVFIRQYVAAVNPGDALVSQYFGRQYVG